jgi:hypothetical protein
MATISKAGNWFTNLRSLQTTPFAAVVTDLFRQTEKPLIFEVVLYQ